MPLTFLTRSNRFCLKWTDLSFWEFRTDIDILIILPGGNSAKSENFQSAEKLISFKRFESWIICGGSWYVKACVWFTEIYIRSSFFLNCVGRDVSSQLSANPSHKNPYNGSNCQKISRPNSFTVIQKIKRII